MRMPSKLATIIYRFQSGELETAKDVPCPICGGTVHAEATLRRSGSRAGLLSVSLYCDGCRDGIEADGVEPWAGWERIALRPEQRLDPKLSLRELMARHRKAR
ncbi:MAG: hypothetical protein JWN24_1174 [Phycisphaerales bacterium]|nr:hypothetical protein [Phycisphaerales bacterium]